MRDVLKSVLCMCLLVLLLALSSCQKEKHIVIQDEDQEGSMMINSTTLNLIARTTSNDGSWDNIIDGSSCFDINFPYSVSANGIEITIDSPDNLQIVEEIFDALDADDDLLIINFPVIITKGDYTEIAINSIEELLSAAKLCVEGGIDDDIECIDIVYPVTIYTFDSNIQILENYSFRSDYELRRFIAGINESDRLSIQFPLSFKMHDGSEKVTKTLDEIFSTISAIADGCDEDDDNDHNDDDFTKASLDELLITCPWSINEFEKNAVNQIDYYKEYVLVFAADNTVKAINKLGDIMTGVWSTSFVNYDLLVEIHFDEFADFNNVWNVYEIKKGKVKFHTKDFSKVVLVTDCNIVIPDRNPLRDVLLQCEWIINTNKFDGQSYKKLLGYKFIFNADGSLRLTNGETTSVGIWNISVDIQEKFSLSIVIADEPGVTYEWPLNLLDNKQLNFETSDASYQLVLQRICNDNIDDDNVLEIRNSMLSGTWYITDYSNNQQQLAANYENYLYHFLESNRVTVTLFQTTVANTGLWRVLRNSEGRLIVYLNFGEEGELGELTAGWEVNSFSDVQLELMTYNKDGTMRSLVLQK